ncbi:MAG: hypothetical protein O7A62_11600 [Alphaproteobacteria bacterium]|nr:hypothetical protein [Alphaproteobacteria bacterium]
MILLSAAVAVTVTSGAWPALTTGKYDPGVSDTEMKIGDTITEGFDTADLKDAKALLDELVS